MDNEHTHTTQEIDYAALQALIGRVEHAIENDLALDAEDMRLLLSAIHTLLEVQSQLDEKSVTLNKLRKLLGMVRSTEQRSSGASGKRAKTNKERKPRPKPKPPEVDHHSLETHKKGDPCPACPNGQLVKTEPAVLLRVTGAAPFEARKHIAERLKCNLCDYVVTADLPEAVINDGGINQQYGYSARAMMAIFKHFSGVPYYHLQTLNDLFGCSITASTTFDQCEQVANACMPIYYQLRRDAGNALVFYIDDTANRILDQKGEERPNRNGKGTRMRTGIYTSGMIAITQTGKRIYLYHTSLGHAGEFLDEILALRDANLPAPIIMSDALSSNLPTVSTPTVIALCNAHARRQFFSIVDQYPEELEPLLDHYDQVWRNNRHATEQGFDTQQRLAHHSVHSLPLMVQIKEQCERLLESPDAEQHGNLAKACRYFLKHYDGLTQFCQVAEAPIDNNLMEEGLKIKIRTRKNSHFYKTQTGADVANVLITVIATVYRNDGNPFDYLNQIQRHQVEVKSDPAAWLPWKMIADSG